MLIAQKLSLIATVFKQFLSDYPVCGLSIHDKPSSFRSLPSPNAPAEVYLVDVRGRQRTMRRRRKIIVSVAMSTDGFIARPDGDVAWLDRPGDRKSTRLNSSHVEISYAVFCLKKKKRIAAHC